MNQFHLFYSKLKNRLNNKVTTVGLKFPEEKILWFSQKVKPMVKPRDLYRKMVLRNRDLVVI